jgi:hypothetical protein
MNYLEFICEVKKIAVDQHLTGDFNPNSWLLAFKKLLAEVQKGNVSGFPTVEEMTLKYAEIIQQENNEALLTCEEVTAAYILLLDDFAADADMSGRTLKNFRDTVPYAISIERAALIYRKCPWIAF